MRIFICGRYTPDGSHETEFARTAESIEAKGHTAVNPAALLPRDLPRSKSIKADEYGYYEAFLHERAAARDAVPGGERPGATAETRHRQNHRHKQPSR